MSCGTSLPQTVREGGGGGGGGRRGAGRGGGGAGGGGGGGGVHAALRLSGLVPVRNAS